MKKNYQKKPAFTLIEILVVIGMIAVLATIVIVAINPARQFASSRNTQRLSNVNAILNAVGQNIADNQGIFKCSEQPSTTPLEMKMPTSTDGTGLMNCLVPSYLSSFLYDPKTGKFTSSTTYSSNYWISQDDAGRLTVGASGAENGSVISVTR